jgi:hypothetical protein
VEWQKQGQKRTSVGAKSIRSLLVAANKHARMPNTKLVTSLLAFKRVGDRSRGEKTYRSLCACVSDTVGPVLMVQKARPRLEGEGVCQPLSQIFESVSGITSAPTS